MIEHQLKLDKVVDIGVCLQHVSESNLWFDVIKFHVSPDCMACNFRNSDNFRYFKGILLGFEIDSDIFQGLHTVVHTFGGFVHTKVCGLVGFVNGYSMLKLNNVAARRYLA